MSDEENPISPVHQNNLCNSKNAGSSSDVHNPSPPPSDGLECLTGDAIGDTLYSQRWVLRSLMKLNEAMAQKNVSKGGQDDDDGDDDDVQELDSDVEIVICQLWDMTTEQDVVHYLLETPSLDILTEAITHTKIPRLTEIAMGILANIACVEEGVEKMTGHEKLKFHILHLLDSSDSPTLIELIRMLSAVIRSEIHRNSWIECIRNDENFLPHITFILASSTNIQLLTITASFIDSVLDSDEHLCEGWSTPEFVDSVLEAACQLNSITSGIYLHILHLLSGVTVGKGVVCRFADSVLKVGCSYVAHISADEDCSLSDVKLESGLASAVGLFHVLILDSNPSRVIMKITKEETIVSLIRLVCKFRVSEVLEDTLVTLLEEIVKLDEGVKMITHQVEKSPESWHQWATQLPQGKLKDLIIS